MDPEAKLLIILFSTAIAVAIIGISVVYSLIRHDRKKR
jgi:hypothetical protein